MKKLPSLSYPINTIRTFTLLLKNYITCLAITMVSRMRLKEWRMVAANTKPFYNPLQLTVSASIKLLLLPLVSQLPMHSEYPSYLSIHVYSFGRANQSLGSVYHSARTCIFHRLNGKGGGWLCGMD